jgi:hypothetical protein
MHEVFGRVGNMQARKTGHGKIDQRNSLSCTRENKVDKKLVKEKLLVCAGLINIQSNLYIKRPPSGIGFVAA